MDEAGTALSGVRAVSMPEDETFTDTGGHFVLERTAGVVRFSRDGYTPLTVLTGRLGDRVVLKKAPQPPWSPKSCPTAGGRRLLQAGGTMAFVVPKGTTVHRREVIDQVVATVAHRGREMRLGDGVEWSWGLPSARDLERAKDVVERDVKGPRAGVQVAEYRGKLPSGARWRLIATVGESASYKAPPETAAYFDTIMDALCWAQPR